MALEEYLPSWVMEYLSPIVLIVGGVLALLIVAMYLKDKESGKYKATVLLGFLVGVLIVVLAVIEGYNAQKYTMVLISVAAFTLIIRPFREIHIAVIVGLMVMVIVYFALGQLEGYQLADNIDLSFLASGWPRIIVAFVAGAIVFGLLNFAEALVKVFGTILNFWPILLILGLVCLAEGCCQIMGYGSIFDYINNVKWDEYVPSLLSMM